VCHSISKRDQGSSPPGLLQIFGERGGIELLKEQRESKGINPLVELRSLGKKQ